MAVITSTAVTICLCILFMAMILVVVIILGLLLQIARIERIVDQMSDQRPSLPKRSHISVGETHPFTPDATVSQDELALFNYQYML